MPNANSLELATEQSERFLRQLVDFGIPSPRLILTGGDPLRRKDICERIDYANDPRPGSFDHAQRHP